MGRRFIVPIVIAAATLGLSAGPAFARTHRLSSFTNGSHRLSRPLDAPAPYTGNAKVVRHGANEECTVPTPRTSGGYTNIFSKDTSIVFDGTPGTISGAYVGTCSADLNFFQNIATGSGKSTTSGLVKYSKTYSTYAEVCTLTVPGDDFHPPYNVAYGSTTVTVGSDQLQGNSESIAYADGEFVQTCIAYAGGSAPDSKEHS